MAARGRSRDSVAELARFARGTAPGLRARAAQSGARRVGRAAAGPAGFHGQMGWRKILRWRALFPQMDFHDLHDAAAARLRARREQSASAEGLRAASRPGTSP